MDYAISLMGVNLRKIDVLVNRLQKIDFFQNDHFNRI